MFLLPCNFRKSRDLGCIPDFLWKQFSVYCFVYILMQTDFPHSNEGPGRLVWVETVDIRRLKFLKTLLLGGLLQTFGLLQKEVFMIRTAISGVSLFIHRSVLKSLVIYSASISRVGRSQDAFKSMDFLCRWVSENDCLLVLFSSVLLTWLSRPSD